MAQRIKTGGRKKGTPNKTTALLKDAILKAATDAGDGDLSAYLLQQANGNPTAFLTLLGKVLPMQVGGEPATASVIFSCSAGSGAGSGSE